MVQWARICAESVHARAVSNGGTNYTQHGWSSRPRSRLQLGRSYRLRRCTLGKQWVVRYIQYLDNSDDLTLQGCSEKCSALEFKYMGVGWGGVGQGSNCLCGNGKPAPDKILKDDATCNVDPCSGNKTENCGGNWRTQVYSIECPAEPPPPPSTKTVWIPPGDWHPWNTSSSTTSRAGTCIIHGGLSGVVLEDLPYDLHEIPIFVKAGAVVPTQSMAKQGGPLIWIVFGGESSSGNGSSYDDDGNTTDYMKSNDGTGSSGYVSVCHPHRNLATGGSL